MLTLGAAWAFALLPLPWLLRLVLPVRREERSSLRVPFLERLERLTGQRAAAGGAVPVRARGERVVFALGWILLVLALARPRVVEDPIVRNVPTRDLLLAVDLSGSMATEDFTDAAGATVSRLAAVRGVLDEFLRRREGDRVGLVVFGTAAFVQMPFTEDLEVCRAMLDEAQVGMAGPKTAFGDAIGLAATLFERSDLPQRVLIALTDGNDTGSLVPPEKAAQIARDRGVTIHAVAVGDPTAIGEQALDERALRAVAETTGGGYFHAADRSQLEEVYRRIDAIEVREVETLSHRPVRELYHLPVAALVALLLIAAAFGVAAAGRGRARGPATEIAHG